MRIHIVQKGETLWRIAKQYGIGLDELKRLNAHLANPDYIVPGMEIILPDSGNATSKSTMTKQQQTAPMPTKEIMTAPMPTKEIMTAPVPPAKEIMTAPKEKMTQPVKEVPKKVVETAPIPQPIPVPQPQPAPHIDLMPQFQFDFDTNIKQQQTLQAPASQPMPQPIYIQVPVPQPIVETKIEKEIEYVQVPVPQIIYVPVMQKHHCGKHHCRGHKKPFHHNRCGCHEQQFFHHQQPCGCHEQQHYQPLAQPVFNEFDFQQMPQQDFDCGCGGGGYPSQEMMPYGMPYFEPNYDMAPQTDIAPAMAYPDEDNDGLPDWLLDSSEVQPNMQQDFDPGVNPQGFEEYNPFDQGTDPGQVANYYQDGFNYGDGANPYSEDFYDPYNMQGMPQQMMPQQMIQPNCQGYHYNPHLPQNKPWNY